MAYTFSASSGSDFGSVEVSLGKPVQSLSEVQAIARSVSTRYLLPGSLCVLNRLLGGSVRLGITPATQPPTLRPETFNAAFCAEPGRLVEPACVVTLPICGAASWSDARSSRMSCARRRYWRCRCGLDARFSVSPPQIAQHPERHFKSEKGH